MAVNKEKNKQILITVPYDLLEEIESYWHNNKKKNRNEAVRELIKKGLEADR